MKKDIHPKGFDVTAHCVCGNSFETTSTKQQLEVDICSSCHPFFTGAQKIVDTDGRVERFRKKYAKVKPQKDN